MNIAEEHFQKLMESDSFKKAYLEESIKFDLEMKLKFLKEDIKKHRSEASILKKVRNLENLVKKDLHVFYNQ